MRRGGKGRKGEAFLQTAVDRKTGIKEGEALLQTAVVRKTGIKEGEALLAG